MKENRRQILEMLKEGSVSVEEAERLMSAVDEENQHSHQKSSENSPKPKYLRILVESEDDYPDHPTKVNIRVPMQLLRAGVRLASLIPVQARKHVNEHLKEHGMEMDLSQLTPENLEELVDHLKELTVDVDEKNNKVRIFCE